MDENYFDLCEIIILLGRTQDLVSSLEVNKMRYLVCFLAIGLAIWGSPVNADIYSWTDEDGVKRFSNRPSDGDIKNIQAMEEILYDEEAAIIRKAMETEQEEKRLAEKQQQYLEGAENFFMRDRKLLEKRLLEAESQLKSLEQELEKREDSNESSSSYHTYRPIRSCWPKCVNKPGKPRPPHIRPPGLKPPQVKPPVKPDPYQTSRKRSHKAYRPVKSAPIASVVVRWITILESIHVEYSDHH